MEKKRVYELAKELNTTSKRLMEKLSEININVKNHMSLLEEDQLQALYKHIGVVSKEEKRNDEMHKPVVHNSVKQQPNKEKNAPRIIRKTEIIIDSKNDQQQIQQSQKPLNNINKDRDRVKVADNTTGLRPGMIRSTEPVYKREQRDMPKAKSIEAKKDIETKTVQEQIKPSVDEAVQKEVNKPVPEQKAEQKPEIEKESARVDQHAAKQYAGTENTRPESRPAERNPQNFERRNERPFNENKPQRRDSYRGDRQGGAPRGDRPARESGYHNNDRQGGVPRADRPVKEGGYNNYDRQGSASRTDKPAREGGYNNYDRQGVQKGDRPIQNRGDRTSNQKGERHFGNRNDRPSGGFRSKPLEIPKPDATVLGNEEAISQRAEARREHQGKDEEKLTKRDQKKEILKALTQNKGVKFKPQKAILGKGVKEILSDDFDEILDSGIKSSKKLKSKKEKKQPEPVQAVKPLPVTNIIIPESVTVKDLAEALKKTSTEVIKKLMNLGLMATLNQEIDFDTAALVADEFGVTAEKQVIVSEEDILFDDSEDNSENLKPRPPVVVVMGHVDHGKTSLLDAIKSTNVIASEAGGITQHIGAYTVKINNRNITFLDTPGHEAFTAMRLRGAQATDIAIIVVAADDGVMPQTVEAINHAKAANVSIIVAINKIDKPGANIDKVKQELTEYGLVPEEWGGDVICVPVSAKKHQNIDQLLEMILLVADMLELKADPNRQAKGTVIEALLDKNRGPIATVLVQRGTLKVGDSIITGVTFGRIKAMTDDKGNKVKKAGPSIPVEVLGLSEVPEAGELFYVVTDEKVARQLVEKRKIKQREQQLKASSKVSLDDLFAQIKSGNVKDLNIIVKADVQGSVEAVKQSLVKLSNEEVRINIIHGAVGAINESDVTLAQVSNAIIIGFNVRPNAIVTEAAKNAGVDMRLYRVIYNAIEDIEKAMKGMLEPTYKEVVIGHIEIRQTFKVSGIGTIGGAYVTDGKITRNSDIRVVRDGIVVHEGKLASLKRFKDDVKEVMQGFECGISIEKFNDIKEGDVIEAFVMEEVGRD